MVVSPARRFQRPKSNFQLSTRIVARPWPARFVSVARPFQARVKSVASPFEARNLSDARPSGARVLSVICPLLAHGKTVNRPYTVHQVPVCCPYLVRGWVGESGFGGGTGGGWLGRFGMRVFVNLTFRQPDNTDL